MNRTNFRGRRNDGLTGLAQFVRRIQRIAVVSWVAMILFITLTMAGCPSSGLPSPDVRVTETSHGQTAAVSASRDADLLTEDAGDETPVSSLAGRIERVLDENLHGRRLDVTLHGGWQAMHGLLAYGRDFRVSTDGQLDSGSSDVELLSYLLDGGRLAGFDPMMGDSFVVQRDAAADKRRGLRFELQPTTKVGQGHRDQWFAILSQCGLSEETKIVASGRPFEMSDVVRQSEYDVPLNLEEEFSWTLIALVEYRGTEHAWTARDGHRYSIPMLLEVELNKSLESSVCGGTHRLNGIAMALNRRRQEGRPIEGVWATAQSRVDEAIEKARRNQNPDGSYSLAYLHRSGWARDLSEQLGTTGHVLEFLALAADDATLTAPWVMRSAERICDLLEQCGTVDLECGVLYHALHGLQEYHARITVKS